MSRCTATKMIEDEVCKMPMQCERDSRHKGKHRTTYPGVDGGLAIPIEWEEHEDKTAAKFYRGERE